MSSVPLVKAQSYLNWQHNEDELEEPDLALGSLCGPLRSEHASTTVLTEQVHVFVNAIARFLDVDASALDGFEVHSCHDLDWLDRLVVSGRIRTDELTELREQIERGESYFLASQRIIYLGSLSIDHAAEEAAHYVNLELAGHVDAPVNRVADFYIRAMREAIAYFGSKLINPKRSCFHREDIAEALERMHGRRLTPKLAVIRDVLRGTLRHLDFETERAAGRERGYPRFRALYRRPLGVHAGITHSLGYRLGDRLYDAVVAGRTTSEPIRELFHEPFTDPSRPRTCYFEWLDRLERLDPERPD